MSRLGRRRGCLRVILSRMIRVPSTLSLSILRIYAKSVLPASISVYSLVKKCLTHLILYLRWVGAEPSSGISWNTIAAHNSLSNIKCIPCLTTSSSLLKLESTVMFPISSDFWGVALLYRIHCKWKCSIINSTSLAARWGNDEVNWIQPHVQDGRLNFRTKIHPFQKCFYKIQINIVQHRVQLCLDDAYQNQVGAVKREWVWWVLNIVWEIAF